MVSRLLVVALVGLTASGASSSAPGGVRSEVSEKGVTYGASVISKLANAGAVGTRLPDQSGAEKWYVGEMDWKLTDMTVTHFDIGRASAHLGGQGATLTSSGLTLTVTGSFSYTYSIWPHEPSDNGKFTATVAGDSSCQGLALFQVGSTGKPHCASGGVSTALDQFSISIGSSSNPFLQPFEQIVVTLFNGVVKSEVTSAINAALTDVLNNQVNALILDTLDPVVSLPSLPPPFNGFKADFRLLPGTVSVTTKVASVDEAGLVFDSSKGGEVQPPFLAASPSDSGVDQSKTMFTLLFSPFMVESAGYAAFSGGLLTLGVSQSDLPAPLQFFMNTSWMSGVCAGLAPNFTSTGGDTMSVAMSASGRPRVSFIANPAQSALSQIVTPTDFEFIVHPPAPAHPVSVFTLSCGLKVHLTHSVSGTTLRSNVTHGECALTQKNSTRCGPHGIELLPTLNQLISGFMDSAIIPAVSKYLASGLTLPTVAGLSFVNPVLRVPCNDTLELQTDVSLSLAEARELQARRLRSLASVKIV
jgi:hypothetical protein